MKQNIQKLGFRAKEHTSGIFMKKYADGYAIELDFGKKSIHYGDKIVAESKTTQNFSQAENWVVLECVNRLLEKGYKPENIILEKTWASGHGTSGRLDICVTRDDGSEYLLIECKTWGKEFEKELAKMKKDGGQLFTYFKFSNKADVIMLYASELNGDVVYRNETIKIEDDYRTGDKDDFYDKWNKISKDNGVFDGWVTPYHFVSKALTPKLLKPIEQEDSGFIFNRFLEILRHNVVSDKPNAFNKIFTLFLCKVYDEKSTRDDEELKFQWLEGKDDHVSFQLRLADLYKSGMLEFLEKEVTDFSLKKFDEEYKSIDEGLKEKLRNEIAKLRLEKNNEFAIKEVFDHQSFVENAKIVKEVVELLQGFRIRYNQRQQYLSDFFELLLTTGLKQESGQFFTPVPIAQFIIKSLPLDTMVDKKLTSRESKHLLPYIMDYAAGSGHFLTESMHEIQRLLNARESKDYISGTSKKIRNWQEDHFDWATQYVYGIEKDYRLVKVGKVGCYLHGDGLANVILGDGLANFKKGLGYKGVLKETDGDFPQENKQFDIVVSNPPYSVSSFKNAAREHYNEKDFELYSSLTDNSSEIECLFIERTKQLLKDGGVAGIILPSSILSNSGIYSKAREMILQYFDIIAIAELGSNTFMATGTNTVTLFLRRRNNYDSINLKQDVAKFFKNLQDDTLNGIESPVAKYVNHVWDGISFDDYKTLLQKSPNQTIKEHDIYQEYQKKIKAKEESDKWENILDIEAEKLLYFIMAYPQQLVLVKTGHKKEEKQFLGYEFSNRRGSEGIHPMQRGKNIDECTSLFDPKVFDNPEKASTYIYKAFEGDFHCPINNSLKNNVSRIKLVDMMTFDRVEFEKNISLSIKKKVNYEAFWGTTKLKSLNEIADIKKGTSITKTKIVSGNIPVVAGGKQPAYFHNQSNREGSVITISASGANAGFINYFSIPIFASDCNTVIAKQDNNIPTKLIYYFLRSMQNEVYSLQKGQAQPHVYGEDLSKIKIPFPSQEVQEKIIAEIESIEESEAALNKGLSEFKSDIEVMISNISANQTRKLDQLMTIVRGASPRPIRAYQTSDPDGVNWIKIGDVSPESKYIVQTKEKITLEGAEKSRWVKEGDFILSNSMSFGRPYILRISGCIHDGWLLLSEFDAALERDYLYYILCSQLVQEQFIAVASGGTTVDNLNIEKVSKVQIPFPPLTEQQRIVEEIESIEAQIEDSEKKISAIPAQKEAILKKYLE